MNEEVNNKLMYAAKLLTKAASCLEYNVNLQKEAAATTDMMIDKGLLNGDQRDTYTKFLTQNPEKIASMNAVLHDLRTGTNAALGEVSGNSTVTSIEDDFDREILGL